MSQKWSAESQLVGWVNLEAFAGVVHRRHVRIAVSRKSTKRQQSTHKILMLMLTPVKYNWLIAELTNWEYKRQSIQARCRSCPERDSWTEPLYKVSQDQ